MNLTTIELDEGEKIPKNLNQFDAMLCMGGPMDTWMEDKYPWLIDEKKRITEFVRILKKPYAPVLRGGALPKFYKKYGLVHWDLHNTNLLSNKNGDVMLYDFDMSSIKIYDIFHCKIYILK